MTVFQGQGADCGAEPIGDELGVGKVESVEDDDELLTAVAADAVVTAELAAETVGHRDEDLVSDEVAVGVVDRFEVVEVAEQEGDGFVVSLTAGQHAGGVFGWCAA